MGKTRRQSGGQPLSYVNPTYQNPSAPAGQNVGNPLSTQIVRPALAQQQQGGFYPSIMGGVVQNARLLIPIAARQGMSLFAKYKKGHKTRRHQRNTRRRQRKTGRNRK